MVKSLDAEAEKCIQALGGQPPQGGDLQGGLGVQGGRGRGQQAQGKGISSEHSISSWP